MPKSRTRKSQKKSPDSGPRYGATIGQTNRRTNIVAGAIGVLSEAASKHAVDAEPSNAANGGSTFAAELEALRQMNSVLGVLDIESEAQSDAGGLDAKMIETKLAERVAARQDKDWAKADVIRDELLGLGIAIKDGPEGTTWKRVVG